MGYRIENKPISITGKRSLTKMVNGKTGDIYKYNNSAVKIFRDSEELPIDEQTARHLTTIPTERILLPKNLVFYNNAFRGYSMKLIPKKGRGKRMITEPATEVVDSIRIIEKDAEKISGKKVLLSGVTPDNAVFNGNLYLCNPSGYRTLEVQSPEELDAINKFQIHLLLVELIIAELKKGNYSPSTINRVREMLSIKDADQKSSEFFEDVIDGQGTIKQMMKKLV